ncbi:NAD-dependent epimerase/dehydratase family protein [Lampropedia aestuarii]|nr:NAD-dependent epimerase/dehydratase family protein [Lampropedia aestuarii]
MRILITGANGFIGQGLVQALCEQALPITEIIANDINLSGLSTGDARLRRVTGPLDQPDILAQLLAQPLDWVFHLAGITSKRAEEDLALGLAVNVHSSMALLAGLAAQQQPARLVFASSIGVFGVPLPARVDDDTPIAPTMSYGVQKRMIELLVADYARRGLVDGRTVRLPGVLARPQQSIRPLSAFSSDILHCLAAGQRFTCPVSPQSTNWLLSRPCCVAQLIHALQSDAAHWPSSRAVTLPAQRLTTNALVQALEQHLGRPLAHLVDWAPVPEIEAQFANWPELDTPAANALGFVHDGSGQQLVAAALQTA